MRFAARVSSCLVLVAAVTSLACVEKREPTSHLSQPLPLDPPEIGQPNIEKPPVLENSQPSVRVAPRPSLESNVLLPGYRASDYWELANNHKHPMKGGPTAGWKLAVRKQDGCLLVIASHGDRDGSKTVAEISVDESQRFERDSLRVSKLLSRSHPKLNGERETRS